VHSKVQILELRLLGGVVAVSAASSDNVNNRENLIHVWDIRQNDSFQIPEDPVSYQKTARGLSRQIAGGFCNKSRRLKNVK